MKIWLVSIFENTPIDDNLNARFYKIAQSALERGHTITYWASTFKHNTKEQRFEKTTKINHAPDYELVFVKSEGYKGNISLNRLKAYYTLSKSMVKEMEAYGSKPDIILIAYPPVSLAHEICKWAYGKEIPVVTDIIDPWPDTFLKMIPTALKGTLFPMREMARKSLKKVSGVTAISKQYIDWAKSYCQDIPLTSVFYPATDFDAVQNQLSELSKNVKRDSNKFTVMYAGSFGSAYDIPCILKAAKILHEKNKNIQFKIAGSGPQQHLVEDYCKEYDNMTFYGRLSKEELMKEYYLSDLGMTQHTKDVTQSVTYKLFDLLSAGLPILNSLESEMKAIILENKVGLHNNSGDAEQLVKNIEFFYDRPEVLEEYKQNGFKLTEEKGDSKKLYPDFVEFLEKVVSKQTSV